MAGILLSIDWDFFVPARPEWQVSLRESVRNQNQLWYKRYLVAKRQGEDLSKTVDVIPFYYLFPCYLQKYFSYSPDALLLVTDSHKYSYELAREMDIEYVILFDTHADLGYGGLASLDYEVNCANWLGKLLQEKIIKRATIVYSPHTLEDPGWFSEQNRTFPIGYTSPFLLPSPLPLSAIHICRSGAWTPPWLDQKFEKLVRTFKLPVQKQDLPARVWKTSFTLAEQVDALIC
ncbi:MULTISPECIES: hypothetical protein [Carboxydocella]|uniref:Arginase family protein n=2 Tax=Carboxydocella TaxID=178898 RepID=A0A1T4MKG5_9FIRM|nr:MULTISPECIES: hypothetical protein [Carboxydocella]AVX21356.1 hypothetical protein CFE_2212 [Carboxydocella thermautotrophica]AVX31852.1 hypothetical protein CTH_2312 [Carboxydocella thermautotrophica]GAW31659.1 hypothetical protein JDF658_14240 [Carboxydocella sp. JDF658]SJZ67254.1 hypothetical protein SAMN02745885_00622 [Carboxydocella sporoproducens DSM 16521]